ncbi:hypothetical protein LJC22_01320 [Desulfosarcina sp. OttesenSCG-928-G10]|nr:hypothetical protein [Desulfosarcina sp. OttesenSCG-928-G10]MDL2320857.1 hypothetical protein [Desulfosarcina sp. OttesenSCG-928-B08]
MEKDSRDDDIIELTQRVEDSGALADTDDIIELNMIIDPLSQMDEDLIELSDILAADASETVASPVLEQNKAVHLQPDENSVPVNSDTAIHTSESAATSHWDALAEDPAMVMTEEDPPEFPDLVMETFEALSDADTAVIEPSDVLAEDLTLAMIDDDHPRTPGAAGPIEAAETLALDHSDTLADALLTDTVANTLEADLTLAEDDALQRSDDIDAPEPDDALETTLIDRSDGLAEDIARALTEEDPAQMGDPAEKSVIEFPDDVAMALTPEDLLHGLGMGTSTDDAPKSAPHFPPPSDVQMEAALERVVQKLYGEKIERLLVDTIEKTIRKEIETLKSTLLSGNAPR